MAAIGLCGWGVASIGGAVHANPEVVSTVAPRIVAAARVERTDLARTASYAAELRPFLQADLHAKIAGYLKVITVDIGDRVTAGQVIATLEMPEQEADLARAQADYDVVKLNYQRISEISRKEPGLLAQQEVDKARGDYGMALGALNRARAFVEYAKITAPFDGVITKRYADPGTLIQAGTASSSQAIPIVQVAEVARLRLDFSVPQSFSSSIRPGMPVTISISATGEIIHATVARDTENLDRDTRMMTVEVDIANRDMHLKPGMYATAEINVENAGQVLTLPVQAVAFGSKPDVWRIDPQGKIQPTSVALGLQTAEKVEVVSGLKQGDGVVFGSRDGLAPEMTVAPKFIE